MWYEMGWLLALNSMQKPPKGENMDTGWYFGGRCGSLRGTGQEPLRGGGGMVGEFRRIWKSSRGNQTAETDAW